MGSVSMQSQACSRGERLSAVVDGEWLDEPGRPGAMLAGLSPGDRAAWSDYHLIGDALRSDELALDPGVSRAFLARFSMQLELEPHVIAPSALAAGSWRGLRRRVAPALAIAAAVATLSWIVVPQLQHADGTGGAMQTAAHRDAVQTVAAVSPDGRDANIIRDASLDQYLEAHQQFAQQPMMPGALVRAAAMTSSGQ